MSWAIPLRNKNLTKNSKLLGLANAFAGGIFLMLAFGHMLPHSVGVLESIGKDRNIAFKFTLVGYLLVFFIEKIAFNSHAMMHDAEAGTGAPHLHHPSTVRQVTNEQSKYGPGSPQYAPTPGASPVSLTHSSGATVIEADDVEVSERLREWQIFCPTLRTALCCTVLCCAVIYCPVLYCTLLFCAPLYPQYAQPFYSCPTMNPPCFTLELNYRYLHYPLHPSIALNPPILPSTALPLFYVSLLYL
jgi:ZIP Zinc transporter